MHSLMTARIRAQSWLGSLIPEDRAPGVIALSVLGALCGAVAGLAISALHLAVDWIDRHLDPALTGALPEWPHYAQTGLTILSGAVLIGLLMRLAKPRWRAGGFVHIIERLTFHQGHMPGPNTVTQFLGGVVALGSGQIVGREGVAGHIGAAGGSWLGARLRLPANAVRTLVGCGAAAGISASFNTPLAGVIFTMEVIVMEYTVAGLAPTIIAAVSGNVVAHLWLQSHPRLMVETAGLASYSEIPALILMGITIGLVSAVYVNSIGGLTKKLQDLPVAATVAATGVITALAAWLIPELANDGFTTINATLAGDVPLSIGAPLLGLVLLCSTLAIATAIPGGVIMPSMVAGALLGAVFAQLGQIVAPEAPMTVPLYALLGLGAMMGAVLQAPLTALIVIVELSSQTEVLFPAMLTVITAVLVNRHFSRAPSLFSLLLRNRGLDYRNDPLSQSLRRVSVMAAMNRQFVAAEPEIELAQARDMLESRPDWFLVRPDDATAFIIAAADVLHALNTAESEGKEAGATLALTKIPGDRRQCVSIDLRASLQEAWDSLEKTGSEALFVERPTRHGQRTTYGVLTRRGIERAYRA